MLTIWKRAATMKRKALVASLHEDIQMAWRLYAAASERDDWDACQALVDRIALLRAWQDSFADVEFFLKVQATAQKMVRAQKNEAQDRQKRLDQARQTIAEVTDEYRVVLRNKPQQTDFRLHLTV